LRQVDRSAAWRVGAAELAQMAAAAAALEKARHMLVGERGGILAEIAPAVGAPEPWRHYPEQEIYDPQSHAQYFFHAHPPTGRPDREYGHFHVFLRAEGMPAGVIPFHLPELSVANATPPQAAPLRRGAREEICHLAAIAIDRNGEPIRLFTTNRWVTGETWYRAEEAILMLDRLRLAPVGLAPILSRWVEAAIVLFRPQIADLLRQRDAKALVWRRQRRTNVFEDPRLEIMSSQEVDRASHLEWIAASRRRLDEEARPRRIPLPPMAEGWGEGPAD
jgi:hypothetical protein